MSAFLASLPIGRIPGVGKATESGLKEIGATSVGRLQTIDQSLLEERFGRYGRRLYELARGIDHNPVVANRPAKSILAEDTLERDVSLSETDGLIRQLAEKVWNASRTDAVARTVVLKLKTRRLRHPDSKPHAGGSS